MTYQELLEHLKEDLRNEYYHMHFYLMAYGSLSGHNRLTYAPFFQAAAAGEMQHVIAFQDLLLGLGAYIPSYEYKSVNVPQLGEYLKTAISMELQVVQNYALRIKECEELEVSESGTLIGCQATYIRTFLEAQLADSLADANKMKNLLE